MRQRCNNPNNADYHLYGGRGIKICSEWDIYTVFRDWAFNNGYNETLTIDRIDNDGNYEPENCRWADLATQSKNKSNTVLFKVNGKPMCLSELARFMGMSQNGIRYRHQKGTLGYERIDRGQRQTPD